MKLINPIDPIEFKEKFLSLEPYPHFCIDNFLDEDFANAVYNAFPTFQEAREQGREFTAVNEKRKIQITDSSKFPPAIKQLSDLIASQEYIDMWSELIGIPDLIADPELIGGGIHETNSGGHLDVHVDFNYDEEKQLHRRLNILIYFNKEWKEEYGGYLDIWDKDVKKRYGYFKPQFNRACGFVTSGISYHGVTPLTCPTEVTRKSFATYYYTKAAPAGWSGEKHSTIFKARPTEWLKGGVQMPLEKTARKLKSVIKGTKEKIKSTLR